MKTAVMTCCFFWLWGTAACVGQVFLSHPDQFYTDGKKVDGWTRNESEHLKSTLWFGKNPAGSLTYRQQLVIEFDSDPGKAYYKDQLTKKYTGRFDMDSEKYSLLPMESRRERLEDIDDFPPAGRLPTIAQMFDEGELGNQERMLPPPPTKRYPRFHKSSWDSNYTTEGKTRVRATITFNGNRGVYRLVGTNTVGALSNVRYDMRQAPYVISGQWSLRGSTGSFRFSIPRDNLNVFWGDWGFRQGRIAGEWDGMRKPR